MDILLRLFGHLSHRDRTNTRCTISPNIIMLSVPRSWIIFILLATYVITYRTVQLFGIAERKKCLVKSGIEDDFEEEECVCICMHTHKHTHSHTNTHSLSLSLKHTHIHTHIFTHTLALTHIHLHTITATSKPCAFTRKNGLVQV